MRKTRKDFYRNILKVNRVEELVTKQIMGNMHTVKVVTMSYDLDCGHTKVITFNKSNTTKKFAICDECAEKEGWQYS